METLLWLFNLWRKTKQKRELCVCVCVFGCIWASNSVARATRPERCANINTEKRERRRRERDWAGGKLGHSACSIKNTRHVCLGGKSVRGLEKRAGESTRPVSCWLQWRKTAEREVAVRNEGRQRERTSRVSGNRVVIVTDWHDVRQYWCPI